MDETSKNKFSIRMRHGTYILKICTRKKAQKKLDSIKSGIVLKYKL